MDKIKKKLKEFNAVIVTTAIGAVTGLMVAAIIVIKADEVTDGEA